MARGVGLHHLALLRAIVHGMWPVEAARRYLPEAGDKSTVDREVREAARAAGAHLVGLGEAGLADALARAAQFGHVDAAEGLPAMPDLAADVPTLEEFAAQFDVDVFSERELQELFEQEYGAGVRPSGSTVIVPRPIDVMESALRGLSMVQSLCVRVPRGDDPASMWLSERLCAQLQPFGVLRMRDVVTLVNQHGRTWWRMVPGLGRARAERLSRWLNEHQGHLGVKLSVRVTGQSRSAASQELDTERNLTTLRAPGVNALGAGSDAQAIEAWLETLTLKSSHTLRAYRRDVQRLLLWARERGKGLTTLVVSDAVEHASFLQDPPAHWVNPLPTSRASVDWRPMRGPLSSSSANRALAAIGHLYGFLVEAGYLVANPFARVRSVSGTARPSVSLDTTRAFSADHLALIDEALHAMADDMVKRRLVAILALAETTGLRISEMVGHTWADLHELPREGAGN